MLHDFIRSNCDELISRTRARVSARPWPSHSSGELENDVRGFLTQLSEALRPEMTAAPFPPTAMGPAAAKHGGDLLAKGFTISQVVHDYGDVCETITELAVEKVQPVSLEEFHTLNRCLDAAIAEAVAEYGRRKAEATSHRDLEHRHQIAHELRNFVQTALLSFRVLKAGKAGASGSAGAVLGRSLVDIRDLAESIVSEVRLAATLRRSDRVSLRVFVDEISVAANLHAEYRNVHLAIEPVDPTLAIEVDPQLLASAVMNLLHNAFKFTRADGRVTIRTCTGNGRVFIEVEDECGGLGRMDTDLSRSSGDRRARSRLGLGLGLSIARSAVAANGGSVHTRDLPGKGCVFTVELPLASREEPVSVRQPLPEPPRSWGAVESR